MQCGFVFDITVAYYMEGRSDEQCEQRWEHLHNVGKMGRWTEQEDKVSIFTIVDKLIQLVHKILVNIF